MRNREHMDTSPDYPRFPFHFLIIKLSLQLYFINFRASLALLWIRDFLVEARQIVKPTWYSVKPLAYVNTIRPWSTDDDREVSQPARGPKVVPVDESERGGEEVMEEMGHQDLPSSASFIRLPSVPTTLCVVQVLMPKDVRGRLQSVERTPLLPVGSKRTTYGNLQVRSGALYTQGIWVVWKRVSGKEDTGFVTSFTFGKLSRFDGIPRPQPSCLSFLSVFIAPHLYHKPFCVSWLS